MIMAVAGTSAKGQAGSLSLKYLYNPAPEGSCPQILSSTWHMNLEPSFKRCGLVLSMPAQNPPKTYKYLNIFFTSQSAF